MFDQNTIIEIVNANLPILASSPVLIKLINSVENLLKTLFAPALTFINGKVEINLEIYRRQQSDAFLENQTFTLYEITKLKNFVNSVKFASMELQNGDDKTVESDNIDFDWIMRFFDAVGNVSNEELQKMWGKILAGEIRHSGTCSLRTIDIMHNMTSKEAMIYNRLCEFVMVSGDCYFIFHSGFSGKDGYNNESCDYISKIGLTYAECIIPMIECGLLSIDNDLATDFKENNIMEIHNQKITCFIIADNTCENFISIEPYFLTKSGIELYNVIKSTAGYKTNTDYCIYCFRELKNRYPNLTFSAHRILGENDFDTSDIL